MLTDADEYSLSYMESEPAIFPASDLHKATAALAAACQGLPCHSVLFFPQQATGTEDVLRRAVCAADPEGRGMLTQQQVVEALAAVEGVPHHAITWFRAHQQDGCVPVDALLAL